MKNRKSYKVLFQLRWKNKWPSTLIFWGIHGNEVGGIQWAQEYTAVITAGKLEWILCNTPAIKAWKRFINKNLNRLFGRRMKYHNTSVYEFPLTEALESKMQSADFLLDLHNSSTEGSPLFLITEDMSVGKYFDVEYVCIGFSKIHQWWTDYYMNSCLEKIWVCLECGYLTDTPHDWLREQITNFLRYTQNIWEKPKEYYHQKFCRATHCHKTQKTFYGARDFGDFEAVKKWELIGRDGEKSIYAEKDGFVIWVRKKCTKGKEAFVFWEFL